MKHIFCVTIVLLLCVGSVQAAEVPTVIELEKHAGAIYSAAFLPDGTKLKANNIVVRTVKPANPEVIPMGRQQVPVFGLKREDYDQLIDPRQEVPITAHVRVREMQRTFAHGPRECEGRLVGTDPIYMEMTQIEMDRGRFLSDLDVKEMLPYVVISAGIAERLFLAEDPIGKTIRIKSDASDPGFPYEVVGVTKPRAVIADVGDSATGQEFMYDVYIPITTLWSRMRDLVMTRRAGEVEAELVELSQITLRVSNQSEVKEVATLIKTILDRTSKDGDRKDYVIIIPLELSGETNAAD